jgi:hypothetical protein
MSNKASPAGDRGSGAVERDECPLHGIVSRIAAALTAEEACRPTRAALRRVDWRDDIAYSSNLRRSPSVRSRGLIVLAVALVFVVGCGGESSSQRTAATPRQPGTGADVPENVFQNGSFELGEAPWISLSSEAWGTPFRLTDEVAHSGRYSALLEMRAPSEATGAKVFGVVQEVSPSQFPEIISGYYRVNSWQRGTQKQYLQFAVIVWGATNLPGGFPNHQMRYPLAGISEPPFLLANAKFVFVGTQEPRVGEWVYFERPIKEDFREAWGAVPEGFSSIRVLFETRYDDKQAGSQLGADVVFDDLYMGPAAGNPNGP